jgi:hypothetical protein
MSDYHISKEDSDSWPYTISGSNITNISAAPHLILSMLPPSKHQPISSTADFKAWLHGDSGLENEVINVAIRPP